MSETNRGGLLTGLDGAMAGPRRSLARLRGPVARLVLGLAAGAWIGGGPDRFGEAEGFLGGVRGGCRTMERGLRYLTATVSDCLSQDGSAVRDLGLCQHLEARLWQDKRLDATGIAVEVQGESTVVLKGIVPDEDHKDRAVALARDTRGVGRVVDQLAVSSQSRTIVTPPSEPVPTGIATGIRVIR